MEINTLKTKNNFHNYITIKQADNTSPIELLLCGNDGSQLTDLNTTCTVTLLDTVDNQIRQKSTEKIVGGLLTFKVKNALKANNHNLEVTLSDGSKYPSDGDFTILVSKSHTDRELEIINAMTYDDAVKKLAENVVTDFVEEKFYKMSSEGQDMVEVIEARDGNASLGERLDKIENHLFINANQFGASPSATWQVNRDAFQAANDAAVKVGGWVVTAEPGTYLVKGIVIDDNVVFNMPGVTLMNPDGLSPSVISAKRYSTTGSITKNSNKLTVISTDNIKLGTVVVINQAGGMLNTQFTALTSSIDATTTTITINQNDGKFPRSGYMICGDEIIGYTSISNKTLNGVERGALGTTAVSHNAGDFIGVARHQYAEVTNIEGNVLTLNKVANVSVSNVNVDFGITNPIIRDLKVDANKIKGGTPSSVYGIEYSMVKWGKILDVRVDNGDMGGILLSKGATECDLVNPHMHNCGVVDATSPKGAGLWLFQGCERNRIRGIKVTGNGWVGTYMDDRTSVAEPYDAPNYDNIVSEFIYDLIRPSTGYPPAFIIVGSSRNKFVNGIARGTVTGVEIDHGGQYLTEDGSKAIARDNEVVGVHFDVKQPWILSASGNRLHECTYSENANSVPVVSEGNLVYAVTTTKGNSVETLADVKFNNGTASKPSISFTNDTDTGFYKDSEDILRLALGGQLKYSWYGTEFRLADGVNITTGTGTGTKIGLTPSQKLGFYGRTPIEQQPAIANLPAKDATTQQIRDATQMVIVTLRNLGLISMT